MMTQEYKNQALELLMADQKFKQRLLNLRKKWGIPPDGFSNIKNRIKWQQRFVESLQSDKFDKEFKNLLIGLPRHYDKEIYEYLVADNLKLLPSKEREKVRFFWKTDKLNKSKERLFIEVFSDTTIKDIQAIWSFVNKVQKSATGYRKGNNKPKDMLKRDLMIYNLSLQGKSHKEIHEIIKDKPTCKRLSVSDISKIIARIKKKMRER